MLQVKCAANKQERECVCVNDERAGITCVCEKAMGAGVTFLSLQAVTMCVPRKFHATLKMASGCMSNVFMASPVPRSQMKICAAHISDCGRDMSERVSTMKKVKKMMIVLAMVIVVGLHKWMVHNHACTFYITHVHLLLLTSRRATQSRASKGTERRWRATKQVAPTYHVVESGRKENVLRRRMPLDDANAALVSLEVDQRVTEVLLQACHDATQDNRTRALSVLCNTPNVSRVEQ